MSAIAIGRRLENARRAGTRVGGVPPRIPRASRADLAERLASAVGGCVVESRAGSVVRYEGRSHHIPVDRERLASLPGQPPATVPLVCLDTETTGLGSAAGTVAFLVGLGWWEGDTLRQVQLLLPDHADEPALLDAIAALIPPDAWLVTYNGRAFDWPLLVARYRLARREPPLHAGHLDLLPVVRRLFRHRMTDARLRTVESTLLGIHRHEDVEGRQIPSLYLDFLRGESADPIAGIVQHNDEDVRSLARLLELLDVGYGDPLARSSAPEGDLAGLARSFRRERRLEEALGCLDVAIARTRPEPARPILRWDDRGVRLVNGPGTTNERDRIECDRARLLRRMGRHREAAAAWLSMSERGSLLAARAFIEIAKIHEHVERDHEAALGATDHAARRLAVTAPSIARDVLGSDVRRRGDRLRRRAAKRGAPARST